MNEEWKRFLLQWILPVGIFFVAMFFVFGSFKANIKQSASEEYENGLVSATEDYATNIYNSIEESESIGSAVAELFSAANVGGQALAVGLDGIVKHSNAYMAIACENDGKGINNSGEKVDISTKPYYSTILGDASSKTYNFVSNDVFTNESAVVVTVPIPDSNASVLVFYPVNINSLRRIVTVEKDYDSGAYTMIADADGSILVSTNLTPGYASGTNIWDSLLSENAEASVRRVKTKSQSGNSGFFLAEANKMPSIICYAPIPGTDKVLLIIYNQKNCDRTIEKITKGSMKQLTLVAVLIVLFILTVTVMNVTQIYVNNKSKEDLQEKADNDQLTGLKNKIATEREIKEYMEMYPDTIGMLFLIDIDNFKKINDTMGHAFGDEVLREIGRNIGVNFRVSDVIGRVGGDEFMVFLKNLKEDANTIREAQKLIYFFRHFQVGDYVKYSVTASIGAAVFPAHGTDFESLYKSADAAVYKSKKRGKNQLSFYDDRDKTPEEVAEADAHQINIERKEETPIES